jgi:hypothetical protein
MGRVKLLAAAALALALAATAVAADPAAKHTSAGNSAAKASLLTLKDLGQGWQAGQTGTPGLHLSCPGYRPSGKGIVETGVAGSPAFANSQSGPFVSQTASVYASSSQAAAYWNRAVKAGLIACVTQTVETIGARGVKVKITSQGGLPISKPTSMTAGYRVVATLSSKTAGSHTLYFDVIVVGKGKTLTEITLSSLIAPIPAKVENALALVVAHHIGGPLSA